MRAPRRLMIEVNTLGTMNGTVAALEPMIAAGRGHVINIVSLAGLIAAPGEVAYAASKHGAIAFTLGTQLDLRRAGIRDIHLSAVCPDGIWTPMLEDKLDDPAAAGSFSGVLQTPEAVAAEVGRLIDRPRPVLTIPRWRGRGGPSARRLPFARQPRRELDDARRRAAPAPLPEADRVGSLAPRLSRPLAESAEMGEAPLRGPLR